MNISREYSFTQSNRKTAVRNKYYNIGPGSYEVSQKKEIKEQKRWNTESRKEKGTMEEPGPGYYNISGDIGYSPKYLQ